MELAIDIVFEPNDAFRATLHQASQPLVIAPDPRHTPVPAAPLPAPLPERRTKLWPLALCAFVAVACATIAFMKSPLATHPAVAPYANAVMATLG